MSALESVPPHDGPQGVSGVKQFELTSQGIEAVKLRRKGLTNHEIAIALGLANATAASRVITKALDAWGFEEVHDFRRLELDRLETLKRRLWDYAHGQQAHTGSVDEAGNLIDPQEEIEPSLPHIRMYLRLQDQQARLVGAYAANEVRVTHTAQMEPQVTQDLARFTDLLQQINQTKEADKQNQQAIINQRKETADTGQIGQLIAATEEDDTDIVDAEIVADSDE